MDRNYWDSLADCYEENLLEIAREDRAGALSEELEALGGEGIRVADLGCGPGSLLPLLARHFEEVIAVDYAEQLLDRARQRCRSKKVSYACHDLSRGLELPFRVEVICCINALIDPDSGRRRGMLRSLRSAMRKQGVAIIVVPAFESVFHVYHTLRRIRERSGPPDGLSADEAERLMGATPIIYGRDRPGGWNPHQVLDAGRVDCDLGAAGSACSQDPESGVSLVGGDRESTPLAGRREAMGLAGGVWG